MNIHQIRLIEELAANAWRPEIEQHFGGWRLRYTGGNSRRVNSVWPNAPLNAGSLQEGLDTVEAFYRRRFVPPCFQLCPAALPAGLPRILADRGYTFYAQTEVQTQTIPGLLSTTSPSDGEVVTTESLTDNWFHLYTSASGYRPESLPVRRGILSRVEPPAQFVSLNCGGVPAAAGLGVVERGWLGVFCVVTSKQFRRKGLAVGVMRVLGAWGMAQGANSVYLQVMEDNMTALNLYRKLGFTRLHQYYYAVKDGKNGQVD